MKKVFSILLAFSMVMSLSIPAFAAESPVEVSVAAEATMYTMELTSEGIVSISDEDGNIMPFSSISGYQNGNVTENSNSFLVWVDASGLGGMGVTVKTSCSTWTGTITFNLIGDNGSQPIKNSSISTNGEKNYSNLFHGLPVPNYYLAGFSGIPSGHTIYAQVWIFG